MYLGEFKQNTAATLKIGQFLLQSDGYSPATALSLVQADILLSKNSGTMAQKNDATGGTHDALGVYGAPVNATDTGTLGRVDVFVNKATALPIRHFFNVITADEWDRKYATTGPVMDAGIKARGTTQSCTATGAVLASGEALPDDIVIGDTIALEVSSGNWVSRTITDSALSGDSVTYDTMVPAPTGAVRYKIFAGAPAGLADDFNATQKASINAEVVDVLRTDTVAELAAVPAANASLSAKINWLFMKARNVITQTATQQLVKADDGTTTVGTATVSDNGTTATRGEFS